MCNKTNTTTVAALGHNYTQWNTIQEATCIKTGLRFRTCTRCGAQPQEILPIDSNNHKDTTQLILGLKNVKKHLRVTVCKNCGKETERTEISCTYSRNKCTVCGKKKAQADEYKTITLNGDRSCCTVTVWRDRATAQNARKRIL